MENILFILIALSILLYGMVSGRAAKSIFTPPMIFVLFGFAIHASGILPAELDVDNQFIHLLGEMTLVLVLFTDAARIDLRQLWSQHTLPVRLLAFGLPLTIIAGTAVALILFPSLSFWGAAVLAAILSPTDAALGQVVVSDKQIPVRIRQTLNVESGLNDGLIVPVLLIFLACATAQKHTDPLQYWFQFSMLQVILGPLVGIAVGYFGGKIVLRASNSGWMNHSFQDLSALGLSFLAFGGANIIGGNGFIAAFCAGLALGNSSRDICTCLYEFAEAQGQLLNLLMFMIFGAVMVPTVIEHVDWPVIFYAALSLTLIRILPVTLSLIGVKLKFRTILFLGWFGPRGLASIIFALLMLENFQFGGQELIFTVVVTTVLLSVFAHAVTAYPLSRRYAKSIKDIPDKHMAGEHTPVEEMPLRLPDPDKSIHILKAKH